MLGYTEEEMRQALFCSADQVTSSVLESGLAQALIEFIQQQPQYTWEGSSTELLIALGSEQRPRPSWMKSPDPRWLGRELRQLTNALAKASVIIQQLSRKTGSVRPFRITYTTAKDGEDEDREDFHGNYGSTHNNSDRNPDLKSNSATAKGNYQDNFPHGSSYSTNFSSNSRSPYQENASATAKGSADSDCEVYSSAEVTERANTPTAKGDPDLDTHGSAHGSTHGSSQNPCPAGDSGISSKTAAKTAKKNPYTFNSDVNETTLPFKPGDRVNKRHKRGWVGILKNIERQHGEVEWLPDRHLSRELLTDLRRTA